MNVINPIIFRDICYEIQSKQPIKQEPEEPINLMTFSFGSAFNTSERCRKIGLFVGKKGRHIRAVENKYNVRVNIVTKSSKMQLRQYVMLILDSFGRRHRFINYQLYVLLTPIDPAEEEIILIDEIKQTLTQKWNEISDSENF